METKQAILPLSAPVSISMLLCFGNRHNHITVYDETILISPIGLYQQAMRLAIHHARHCLLWRSPIPHLRRKNSAATRLLNAFIKFNGSQENFSKKKQWVASTSSYLPPMLTRNIFTTIRPHRIGSDLYILQRSPMRPVLNFPFFSTVIIVEDHFNYAVNDLLKSFPLYT